MEIRKFEPFTRRIDSPIFGKLRISYLYQAKSNDGFDYQEEKVWAKLSGTKIEVGQGLFFALL